MLAFAVGDAEAAKRSEKQMEMDRQREEMRRQAEMKRNNPGATIAPPVLPSRLPAVTPPLVTPPPSVGGTGTPPPEPKPEPPPKLSYTDIPTFGAPRPAAVSPPPAAPPAPAAMPVPPLAAAPAPVVAQPPAMPVPAEPAVDPDDEILKDPAFKRGAEFFNSALGLFKRYETERNSSYLGGIPDLCDQAVAAFNAARLSRPGDARIARYIEQCYGLTRYARQSALMAPAQRR